MEDIVFDFLLLPLEIQEIIVHEIVHNSVPDDWLHFAQTSQYSNWLVKRANPKKIVTRFEVRLHSQGGLAVLIESTEWTERFKLITGLNMLQNCQIQQLSIEESVFFEDNSFWNSELETVFSNASKFVTRLSVQLPKNMEQFMNFYQNLKYLSYLDVSGYISNILLLPWIPSKVDICYSSDRSIENFLQKLSQKMKYPISSLELHEVSVYEVKEFLQTSTFLNGAEICLFINDKDHEIFKTEIKPFVKGEPIPSIGKKGLFGPGENGFLLTENLDIVPDENQNLIGIKIWCL